MSLFMEGILATGSGVRVLSLPRGRWTLQRFERFEGTADRAGRFTADFQVSDDSRVGVILCFHWIVLPLAILLKWRHRVPLIYDEHDFYEINTLEGGGAPGLTRLKHWVVRSVHRFCLPRVSLVTCIHMQNAELMRRLLESQPNVLELHNYPIAAWAQMTRESTADQELSFVYVGGVYEKKGVRHAAEAFLSLPENVRDQSRLHIFGDGDPELIEDLRQCPRIAIHNNVTPQQFRQFAAATRACGLVLYNDIPRHQLIGTNSRKLYEYLALRMPVIATRVGEIPAFVEQHGVGLIVDARFRTEQLRDAMLSLAGNRAEWNRLSENAVRLMSQEEMSWEYEWTKVVRTGLLPGQRAAA
ncbi:MAG: glycosyltransferase [Planctomycetaceae bacterium]|nr:glycosyltransferase [Planctomycetaceae bacterium]